MLEVIKNLTVADWIQILILIALAWYSIETHLLRKWQRKLTQLQILNIDMTRVNNQNSHPGNPTPYGEPFPTIIRKIYDLGKFDPKVLYSKAYHQPLTFGQKIKTFWQKYFK